MQSIGVTDSGVQIVVTGLQVWLDAAQKRSYSGTGTIWNELIPFGGFADLYNSPTFDTGNGGNFIFNSTSYANDTITSTLTTWTASLWVKQSSGLNADVNYPALGNQVGLYIFLTGGYGGLPPGGRWGIFDGTNAYYVIGQTLTNGVWYNISVTRNGNTYEFYSDGVYIENTTAYTGQNFSEFWVGKTNGLTGTFPTNLGNVLIYDSVLNATQHLQNFNAIRSRFQK